MYCLEIDICTLIQTPLNVVAKGPFYNTATLVEDIGCADRAFGHYVRLMSIQAIRHNVLIKMCISNSRF